MATRRLAAFERLSDRSLPGTDEEVWRYSRVDELDLDDYRCAASSGGDAVPPGAQAIIDALGSTAGVVVVRNGFVVHQFLEPTWADRGVRFGGATEVDIAESVVGEVAPEATDYFAELNEAAAADPVVAYVPSGVEVTEPLVVIDWIDTADAAVFPRLVVRAGEQAGVTVLDWHGSDDVVAFAAPVVSLDATTGARVRYLNVQDRAPKVWQITSQVSRADRDATIVATQAALGGDYARTRADCRLVGRGATGNLAALYFGEREQMLDFRTFQDHAAPDTTSSLLFKGVVGDNSRSVYTGLIKVRKNGRGTNAFQTNRNIKLSDHAWAESVPNLEIENNDVRCSHASTVGPVDEDQRFYLESRGVPTPIAERLIVAGFFAEVLELLPVPAAVPLLVERLNARLDRRTEAEFADQRTSHSPTDAVRAS